MNRQGRTPKKHEYNGAMYTLKELADMSGVLYGTLVSRLGIYKLPLYLAMAKPPPGITKKTKHADGYIYIAGKGNECGREHIKIAEAALGRRLPNGAVVHHIDNDR